MISRLPDWIVGANPTEAIKLIAAIVSLVSGLVSLVASVVILRRVRLEIQQAKDRFELTSKANQPENLAPSRVVPVTLEEIRRYGHSKEFWSEVEANKGSVGVHGAADFVTVLLSSVLKLLQPVQLFRGLTIPPSVTRRVILLERLLIITVLASSLPIANLIIRTKNVTDYGARFSIAAAVFGGVCLIVFLVLRLVGETEPN